MRALLELQFIIFALIGVGCFVRKKNIVSREGQKNLTDLVIYVILPCNTVTAFMQEIPRSSLYDCVRVFLISAGIQVFCVLYGRIAYRNMEENRRKSLTYGIMISNAGFLGNPVAEGLYGAQGLMLASVYLTPVRVMMWSEGLAIFSGQKDRRATLKKVATHPCVLACFIGIILLITRVFTGIVLLPGPVLVLLQTIGRCNTALSMMVIGMIVSNVKPSDFIDPLVFRYSVERLVVIPAITFAVMMVLKRIGWVSGIVPGLSVMLAAMPAATTTSMLASRYDCEPEFAAKMVIVSTVLSIPTIFLWSLILL